MKQIDKCRSGYLWTEGGEPQMLCSRDMEPLKATEADYPGSSGKEGMKRPPREQSWMADNTHGELTRAKLGQQQ